MAVVLWDASALAKHFVTELGSQTVDAVFAAIPRDQMVTTVMGYSETFAALLRKHNQGALNATALTAAQAASRNEVIDDPDFVVLALEFDDILDGIELIGRHKLNSTDAAILQACLRYTSQMRSAGSVCWSHPINVYCGLQKRKVLKCSIQRFFRQWMCRHTWRHCDRSSFANSAAMRTGSEIHETSQSQIRRSRPPFSHDLRLVRPNDPT